MVTWREEVLASMPVREEISIPEICARIRPEVSPSRRRELYSKVYHILETEVKWGTVERRGLRGEGQKTRLWMRLNP